jgi:hypothetical protein
VGDEVIVRPDHLRDRGQAHVPTVRGPTLKDSLQPRFPVLRKGSRRRASKGSAQAADVLTCPAPSPRPLASKRVAMPSTVAPPARLCTCGRDTGTLTQHTCPRAPTAVTDL